jgi:TPR repeat protein
MFNLGNMYRAGKGVVQSFKKAAELYIYSDRAAANQPAAAAKAAVYS